jgi:uncharacterized protein YvpB
MFYIYFAYIFYNDNYKQKNRTEKRRKIDQKVFSLGIFVLITSMTRLLVQKEPILIYSTNL